MMNALILLVRALFFYLQQKYLVCKNLKVSKIALLNKF